MNSSKEQTLYRDWSSRNGYFDNLINYSETGSAWVHRKVLSVSIILSLCKKSSPVQGKRLLLDYKNIEYWWYSMRVPPCIPDRMHHGFSRKQQPVSVVWRSPESDHRYAAFWLQQHKSFLKRGDTAPVPFPRASGKIVYFVPYPIFPESIFLITRRKESWAD